MQSSAMRCAVRRRCYPQRTTGSVDSRSLRLRLLRCTSECASSASVRVAVDYRGTVPHTLPGRAGWLAAVSEAVDCVSGGRA